MAETDVTATVASAEYATALGSLTQEAADVANGNRFRPSGNDLIIAHNTGVVERTVTITSSADSHNRSGSIPAAAIAAGAIKYFRIKNTDGWLTGGYVLLSASNAEVKFSVIQL